MIKKLAWDTFKNTGNINTFLELIEVEAVEKNIASNIVNNQSNNKKDLYGNNKDKRNNTFRK